MIIYRLAREEYSDALYASGAANRWNKFREFVVYTSGSISLCALELLAHTSGIKPFGNFKVMKIEVSDACSIREISQGDLPVNWNSLAAYSLTQYVGSQWYQSKESLILKIPSAIILSEYNFIINTLHKEFIDSVELVEVEDFFWDSRFPSNH